MFSNIKNTITELAYSAVKVAEDTLNTSTGKERQEAAIEYVVSMLPLASVFKSIIATILSKFIQEAVESAYQYMKSVQNPED